MTQDSSFQDTTHDVASVYALAFTADFGGLALSLRFAYSEPEHVVDAAEWFFQSKSCLFRALFNELSLHADFGARLWTIDAGEALSVLDLRKYVSVTHADGAPRPVLTASKLLDQLDAEEIGALTLSLDLEALITDLPLLEGEPLAAGHRTVVRAAKKLPKNLAEPLALLLDREEAPDPQAGHITYGPVDVETGLRIDGFEDPDPAPPGSPHAPPSLDELRERIERTLAEGDAPQAKRFLSQLERGLTYPLYELRAEVAALGGENALALTNALLGLTPAPTEQQNELLQRTFSTWTGQKPAPQLEKLLDHIERSMSLLDAAELFDMPETISAALRELLDDPPAARLDLLEAIAAGEEDPERLAALLDHTPENEEERPVVAAALLLLSTFRDSWGHSVRALELLQRAKETTPSPRSTITFGLRLIEEEQEGGLDAIRRSAAILTEQDAPSLFADRLFERYAKLLQVEYAPLGTLLEEALDILRREKDIEAALTLAEALAQQGHWLGLYHQGCLLMELDRHEPAVSAFRRALHDWLERAKRRERLDLRDIRADCTFRLACSEAALGRHELALQTLERACRLNEANQTRAREAIVFEPLWTTTDFMRIAGGAGAVKQKTIAVGTPVNHAKFGFGIVTIVDGEGETAKVTIEFKEAGSKKLLARFVKPA